MGELFMIPAEICMSIAYVCFFVGVFPAFKALLTNRKNLKGFSKFGIFSSIVGLTFTELSLMFYGAYFAACIGLLNYSYYITAGYFLIKGRDKKCN